MDDNFQELYALFEDGLGDQKTVEKPMAPAKQMEPEKPMEPAKQMEPEKPMAPTKPMEPAKPMESTKPMESKKPMEPAKPMESKKTMEQKKPMEPKKKEQQKPMVEQKKPKGPAISPDTKARKRKQPQTQKAKKAKVMEVHGKVGSAVKPGAKPGTKPGAKPDALRDILEPVMVKKQKKIARIKVPALPTGSKSFPYFLTRLPLVSFYQCSKCMKRSNATYNLLKGNEEQVIQLHFCVKCRDINTKITDAALCDCDWLF